ncbi:hypothetical protein [Vibrio vulnificus]|uniref:hypothetical protein n=1 Tax=Vibrio vulnificus TaxID=672 RepID=UPI003F6659D4
MNYKIGIWALAHYPEIEISRERFDSLVQSNNKLSAAMALEEKYDVMISNFLELEEESLCLTANYMLGRAYSYSGFFDVKLKFNRRMVNLLTSTRLYLDQYKQHVKELNPNLVDNVQAEFSKKYDTHFEYRFMEALRNYVQHKGLAAHAVKHASKWVSVENYDLLEHKTQYIAEKMQFESDGSFKKSVLKEMPNEVELLTVARKYVSAIAQVHMFIRESISGYVDNARKEIALAISDYKKISDGKSTGLFALAFDDGECTERKVLTLEWDDVRRELINKNSPTHSLGMSYVTSNAL